jgi:hypothetical protein
MDGQVERLTERERASQTPYNWALDVERLPRRSLRRRVRRSTFSSK